MAMIETKLRQRCSKQITFVLKWDIWINKSDKCNQLKLHTVMNGDILVINEKLKKAALKLLSDTFALLELPDRGL